MPVTRRQSIHRDGEERSDNKEVLLKCEECSFHYMVSDDQTETRLDESNLKEYLDLTKKKTGVYPNLSEVTPFTCQLCDEKKTAPEARESESKGTAGFLSLGNIIPFSLIVLAMSLILGALIFDSTNTIVEEIKAKVFYSEKSFAVKMHEQTPEDIKFEKEMFKLEETYSKQEEKVWLTLLAGIKSVMKSNPHQPSVFLMLYDDESSGRTAKCLAQDVSSTATKYMMRWSKKPLVISGIELKKSRLLDDPGLLLIDYNNTVRDRGAMIVTELQDVPPKVATSFHFFCDKYSPLVEKAIYFFTLKVDKLTSWKIQEKAENRLKELWSHEMADHFLQPLITRITPNILKIASDSSNC